MIHLNYRFEIIKEHSGRLLNRHLIFILQGGYMNPIIAIDVSKSKSVAAIFADRHEYYGVSTLF